MRGKFWMGSKRTNHALKILSVLKMKYDDVCGKHIDLEIE